jgi:hypothetical protein
MPTIDMSFAIGLAGTLGTIIFGIIGLIYTFKFQKKTDLCIANLGTTNLFSSITNGIDGLTIEYNNMSVSDTLLLMKAAIINIGTEDIAKTMIYENLQISLGEGYEILNAVITDEAHGVNPAMHHTSKTISLTWDLLKQSEYIAINILAKKTIKDFKIIPMQITSRIQGIKEITTRDKPLPSKISSMIDEILFAVVMITIVSIVLSALIFKTKTYTIAGEGTSISTVAIKTRLNNIDTVLVNDKTIDLENINNANINGVSLEGLFEKTIQENAENKKSSIFFSLFLFLMFLFPTYTSFNNLKSFFRNRKYSKSFPPHLLN